MHPVWSESCPYTCLQSFPADSINFHLLRLTSPPSLFKLLKSGSEIDHLKYYISSKLENLFIWICLPQNLKSWKLLHRRFILTFMIPQNLFIVDSSLPFIIPQKLVHPSAGALPYFFLRSKDKVIRIWFW